LTGSAESISILKKIQNGIVLVKKKKQKSTSCNWVFDRVLPGHRVNPSGQPGHGLCNFFINPARFQPRVDRVPGRPAGPGRVSKHCILDFIPCEQISIQKKEIILKLKKKKKENLFRLLKGPKNFKLHNEKTIY
jgi:hypothetical protein